METTLDAVSSGAGGGAGLGLVVWGGPRPHVVHLPADRPFSIGRGEGADLRIDEPTLSRVHAEFEARPMDVFVRDLDSKNGLHLEGRRLRAGPVEPGQVLEMGGLRVSVALLGGSLEPGRADPLETWLAQELTRARHFGRPLTVAVLRGNLAGIEVALSPVDRCAEWSETRAAILLVETDAVGATARLDPWLARDPGNRAGLAAYPSAGSSPLELIDAATEVLGGTGPEARLRVAERTSDETAPATVVESPAMHEVMRLAERFAASALPVLIRGETGVGKEGVAARIHRAGPRAEGPYRVVNCAAIPESLIVSTLFGHVRGAFTDADRDRAGVFQQSDGGTLLLDEVGELSTAAQAALLRALESGTVEPVGGAPVEVDVRVLAATHRDLDAAVEDGRFRADLLHRLDALTIVVPPLRQRPEDVVALIDSFTAHAARRDGRSAPTFDGPALQRMLEYPWPGNVRELRNAVERASLVCTDGVVRLDDLPPRLRGATVQAEPASLPETGLRERLRDYEVRLIEDALRRCDGNQTEAARLLQIPRRTLVHKLGRFGIGRRSGK
ncbi:MAG TPA: sigma 54-interacting transcriptional regulator [Sandaracinaceae bacterium LLY-WYZ-13_1]|nr:sigma 54-interacting transcriptional regulator [Sandaracinaceae bacterium LLY-WYZ-13_1]